MNIKLNTDSYNPRRYGKPWIAVVDFSKNPKGDYTWGDWVGSPGQAGVLVIQAEVGAIIAQGQKDNRGNGTRIIYAQVATDGKLVPIASKADAYTLATSEAV